MERALSFEWCNSHTHTHTHTHSDGYTLTATTHLHALQDGGNRMTSLTVTPSIRNDAYDDSAALLLIIHREVSRRWYEKQRAAEKQAKSLSENYWFENKHRCRLPRQIGLHVYTELSNSVFRRCFKSNLRESWLQPAFKITRAAAEKERVKFHDFFIKNRKNAVKSMAYICTCNTNLAITRSLRP